MKRFFTMLAATLMLTAALCVSASASDYDAVAEELSAIGMFRGTGASFELDRAPTRAEAAIMLVRLYGAEEEATADYAAGTIKHPFKDVPSFAAPHVAWLYENGLTKGMSADTFGSTSGCSAQNYATFLLRALGYQDGTDFNYADALAYAEEKGFYDSAFFAGDFLRDDLAALTYQALAADTKEGDTYLLASLIADGAVAADAAKPMTEKMELYREMNAAVAQENSDAMDMDLVMDMDMTMIMDEQMMTSSTTTTGSIATKVDGSKVEMAYETVTKADGATMEIGMWLKDGWIYMEMDDGTNVQKVKYPAGDEMAALEELEVPEMSTMDVSGLASLKSIPAAKSGSNTIYTAVISENLGGLLGDMDELLGEDAEGMALDISEMTISYTVNRSGAIKEMQMVFSFAMTMSFPDEESGEVYSVDVIYDYDATMTVNATGSKVKISYPSFSDFVEVDPDALMPVA